MDNDPTYEPILGGHKSFSWEKELRERGLHASANEIAQRGDQYFEGPQGHPAPGSGSPRRDRVSASPQRSSYVAGGTPAAMSDYGSVRKSASPIGSYHGSPSYAQPIVTTTTTTTHYQPAVVTTSVSPQRQPAFVASASPSLRGPSTTHIPASGFGVDNDPTYEPIIGGHKTHSWEKELRERGLHASANEMAKQGDSFFEGPQGHPAPGSGSPRRDRVSASPARGSASPSLVRASGSPMGQPAYAPSQPAYVSTQPAYVSTGPAYTHTATAKSSFVPPPPVSHAAYRSSSPVHAAPIYGSPPRGEVYVQPTTSYRATSGSPSAVHSAAIQPNYMPDTTRPDPTYEPIIGGHKSHSWEKELRERGMHASANEVGNTGDNFFEGPQGHPAPGSGSPRRDRVSASPPRRY
eukprot:TRINITY_DN177_c0_g2_i1.p1 TRINITY_DN177_c0_g2~~TRINITY_DN177_c0_g2_i1.p1  ORF type:complete len:428 (+),score=64.00 TRINITY_DN177_c0_g2_i1:66-1286(+)